MGGLPAEFGDAVIISSQCTGVQQKGHDGQAPVNIAVEESYAKGGLDPVSISCRAAGMPSDEIAKGVEVLNTTRGEQHPVMALGESLKLEPGKHVDEHGAPSTGIAQSGPARGPEGRG